MRVLPQVGMAVRIVHLGATEDALVEDVLDAGRTVVAGGRRFTLRRLNGRYVLEGERSYGPRLALTGPAGTMGAAGQ